MDDMEETQLHIQNIGPPPTTLVEAVTALRSSQGTPQRLAMAPLAQKENGVSAEEAESECTSSSDTDIDEHEQCDCITETAVADIPYTSIYETEKQIRERGYFTQPPVAAIVHAERDTDSLHLIDRYLYTIEVRHGKHQWIILRRYSDFRDLNSKLLLFRAGQNIVEPMHRLQDRRTERRERRLKAQTLRYGHGGGQGYGTTTLPTTSAASQEPKSAKPNTVRVEKTILLPAAAHSAGHSEQQGHSHSHHRHRQKPCKLPHFPLLPDTAVSEERVEQRKDELGSYLAAVLHVPAYRNHSETLEFLGVSRLSFVTGLGLKNEEGYIKKKPGGASQFHGCKRFCITTVAPWRKRWLILKDSYLVYLRPHGQEISEVLLFERGFSVDPKRPSSENPKQLSISNLHRTLRIKAPHEWIAEEWRRSLAAAVQSIGSLWLEPQRFGSSYPVREDGLARWFVDGRAYMEEVANRMEMAKEDIFITDWWLSPEIFMKRPPQDTNSSMWRLDNLLKRKAEQGIRVFVLLYKEVTLALSINSLYTKIKLQLLHPNIKVLRHRGAMNWAHHEKLVIIDQTIAFVGGIDLCYGRWDDHRHRLTDMAGIAVEQTIHLQEDALLAGKLLSGLNEYGKQKQEEQRAGEESITRRETRRFSLRKQNDKKDMLDVVEPPPEETPPDLDGSGSKGKSNKGLSYFAEWKMKAKAKRIERHQKKKAEESDEESEEAMMIPKEEAVEFTGNEKWWVGKDYVNFIFKDFIALDSPFIDFIDRTIMPRMPWHDIASVVYGSAARDVARHFIERWNACKVEKCHDDTRYPFLLPKSYDNVEIPRRMRRKAIGCKMQIIRSASRISTGRSGTEDSIYQAYIQTIEKAEHYVYIENQFFVSQVGAGKTVHNGIAQALFDRIVRAHRNNESFRVYVIMPLLPGFEVGTALFTVLHWTYLSISKGPNSLLKNLENTVGDPSRYITFGSLRKYDSMGDRLVTELIYIHSKLLIVDDRYVIIGSANINDRSQLGDRDSEVAIFAEDTEFEPSTMGGNPYQAGKFAGSLRRQLFREHLGLLNECPRFGADEHPMTSRHDKIDISDPSSESFFTLWKEIAERNTSLFEQIFDCLPNDNIRSQGQLAEYRPGKAECVADRRRANDLIKGIQGFLVTLPLNFLTDSDLTPPLTTKEGWAPSSIFI